MRVIFMGTSEFAVPSLRTLFLSVDHQIALVITQPDMPQGRGLKTLPPPVKIAALNAEIPVLQTEKISTESVYNLMSETRADIIFCAAYGKYLPSKILNALPYGAVNLHPSKLPLYRGAAPIQRTLMDGCDKTAVTFIRMAKEMDAGDILLQKDMDILPEETAGELSARAAEFGAELLPVLLRDLQNGRIKPQPQEHDRATHAPVVEKNEGLINWDDPSYRIFNLWRGLTPKPGIYSFIDSKRFILSRLRISGHPEEPNTTPGTIFTDGDKLLAAAGDGKFLEISEIKPEGKNVLNAAAFINGYKPAGKRFSSAT